MPTFSDTGGLLQLGHNVKRALAKGIIVGAASMLAYLLVVVLTTPALPPAAAVNAALQINSFIIAGVGAGTGLQMFLSTYSRSLGCRLDSKRRVLGGNSGGTFMSGFFSLFSLVPLGCCGTMLYVLSLLPSVVGTGLSAGLIEYSQSLAYLGIAVIFGFNGLTIYRLKKQRAPARSMR